MELLRRLWAKKEAPLRGVPALRRQKNYLAASGYAYEYYHEGWREAGGAREYLFTVSGDRKTWFPLTVVVVDAPEHALADNERYGVAKMALFAAFDERASPAEMREEVRVGAAQVAELLGRLGIG